MIQQDNLGLIIKELRIKKNLTREQLAYDICSISQLYRIENGKHSPSTLLLHQLSNRLSEDMTKYFTYSNCSNPYHFSMLFDRLESLRVKRKYAEMLSLISETEIIDEYIIDLTLPNIKQLLGWYKGISLSNITTETINSDYYIKLLKLTNDFSNVSELFNVILSINEVKLIHSLAASYCRYGNFSQGKILLQSLLNNISTYSIDIGNCLKAEILYNFAKILYIEENYADAIIYANKGVEICTHNNFSSVLADLFYIIGECYVNLNLTENAISYFNKFIFLYDIFGHDEFSSKCKSDLISKYGDLILKL